MGRGICEVVEIACNENINLYIYIKDIIGRGMNERNGLIEISTGGRTTGHIRDKGERK